ncbi:MAG: ribonuclease H-like domain-containing protein [Nitrospirales bacterium]
MLESSFILLKGIGEYTERRLWESGVRDWHTFLSSRSLPGVAPARKQSYDVVIALAIQHFQEGRSRFFSRCLKSRDHWRLLQAFRARTLFLDIETNGAPPPYGDVTVVGLYADGQMTSLVRGISLTEERLHMEFSRYDLLVTFFGSIFDIPYLRAKYPGLVLDQPHVDLCFAARRLGLAGGLKQIEALMGIQRPADVQGLDGWEAVRLWNAWERGDSTALDRLLRYNESDTRNLEPLADLLYKRLVARYGPPALRRATSS